MASNRGRKSLDILAFEGQECEILLYVLVGENFDKRSKFFEQKTDGIGPIIFENNNIYYDI